MTGACCRVLYGRLHIRAYDWADPSANPLDAYHHPLPATAVLDQTFEVGSWRSATYWVAVLALIPSGL